MWQRGGESKTQQGAPSRRLGVACCTSTHSQREGLPEDTEDVADAARGGEARRKRKSSAAPQRKAHEEAAGASDTAADEASTQASEGSNRSQPRKPKPRRRMRTTRMNPGQTHDALQQRASQAAAAAQKPHRHEQDERPRRPGHQAAVGRRARARTRQNSLSGSQAEERKQGCGHPSFGGQDFPAGSPCPPDFSACGDE